MIYTQTSHYTKLSCIIKHVKQNVFSHNLVTDKSIILRLGCNFLSTKHGLFLSLGTFGTLGSNLSRILSSIQYGMKSKRLDKFYFCIHEAII